MMGLSEIVAGESTVYRCPNRYGLHLTCSTLYYQEGSRIPLLEPPGKIVTVKDCPRCTDYNRPDKS